VTALAHRRDLLREQAEQLAVEAEDARRNLAASLTDWQQARSRLEAVEVLHERHRQALTEHDLRQDQRITDDLAVVSTFPRQRTSSPHDPYRPHPTGGDAA
jgi:flagellar export protein FliJ